MGVYNYFMGVFMKKLFVVITAIVFLLAGCDDDPKDKEPNPYPDGVYPFEVSGVGHTQEGRIFTITWANPTDKGFSRAQIEMFYFATMENLEFLEYSSVTGKDPSALFTYDFNLGKDSFSFETGAVNDRYVIIKCVDKFGNISEGVKYEFSYVSWL
jgi:hypothetical protein